MPAVLGNGDANTLLQALKLRLQTQNVDDRSAQGYLGGPDFENQRAIADESQQADEESQPYTDVGKAQAAGLVYNTPEAAQQRNEALVQKVLLAQAPEEAKTAGALALGQQENQGQQQLLKMFTGGKDPNAPGPAMGSPNYVAKPTLTANGKMSVALQPQAMPALVQRSYNQLSDAKNKVDSALAEAEAQYKGITAAAQGADAAPQSEGWLSYLTGSGPKYGSALDQVGAGNERLKYTMGIPTPFAKLAQEASFGNIEQMAGQLPGVRGLATITPLFKEHQARWGHETPLATVQRLLHMKAIMDDSLENMRTAPAEMLGAPEK